MDYDDLVKTYSAFHNGTDKRNGGRSRLAVSLRHGNKLRSNNSSMSVFTSTSMIRPSLTQAVHTANYD